MNSALSPREIQARLRAGASVPEVAAAAGVEVARIDGFALPIMAERAHVTRTALGSSVRRRGDGSGHRRLGEVARERLQARSLDADTVQWDAWRQNDLKWRVVGVLDDQATSRTAEFVFDPKGRFSVADNADARWMIGEMPPGTQPDADEENTIDLNDELALVRAISDAPRERAFGRPGDDVPPHKSPYEGAAHTSELDELYDMLSGVSEDSVRIYLGLDDGESPGPVQDAPDEDTGATDDGQMEASTTSQPLSTDRDQSEETLVEELSEHPDLVVDPEEDTHESVGDASPEFIPTAAPSDDAAEGETANETAPESSSAGQQVGGPASDESEHSSTSSGRSDETSAPIVEPAQRPSAASAPAIPEQDPLVPEGESPAPKRKPAKKRASIPSWDEIMFGGPPRS